MSRAVAGLAMIIVAFAVFGLPTRVATAQGTVHVESGNLYFCAPSFAGDVCDTTITAGDTVVWDNVEGVHTVTQCDADFTLCPPAGGFDSGVLNPGDTYSLTFDTAGTFPYWCAFHPIEMRGRIIVQQPTPTPSPTPEPTAEPTATPVGQTPSPTPAVTATPAAVPDTGGSAGEGGPAAPLALVLSGIVAVVLGAAVVRFQVRE